MTDQQTAGNPPAVADVGDLLHLAGGYAALAVACAETMRAATSHLDPEDLSPEEHAAVVQAHAALAQALYIGASVHLAQSGVDALATIADELCTIARDLRRVDSRRAS